MEPIAIAVAVEGLRGCAEIEVGEGEVSCTRHGYMISILVCTIAQLQLEKSRNDNELLHGYRRLSRRERRCDNESDKCSGWDGGNQRRHVICRNPMGESLEEGVLGGAAG